VVNRFVVRCAANFLLTRPAADSTYDENQRTFLVDCGTIPPKNLYSLKTGGRAMKKTLCILVITLTLSVLLSGPLGAQGYPAKPLEIVCGYTPGSSMDLISRVIADVASKHYGQPVVVLNKPGASGSVGAADVITSKPEGYKVLLMSQAFFVITLRTMKAPFSPDDLVPLANFVDLKLGLMVQANSPFKTFNDLLAYGKKNPSQLKWAHTGRGSTLAVSTMLIFKKENVTALDVPFKGTPEAFAALLGGHVDAGSLSYAAGVEHIRSGKLRMLMFFGDKRYKDQPDVPNAFELGYQDSVLPTYVGLYAHKNTPENIKQALMNTFKKTYDDPDFKKGIEKLSEQPLWGTPEFIRGVQRKQEEIAIPLLKEIGVYTGK
jgi:tripartite-type tricarboxylate transporter receptor subunit TctC